VNILFGLPDSVSRIAAEAFLNSIWQSAVLALFVWLLLRLFKRASATMKYGVWSATLVAIVCLPFLNALTSSRATAMKDAGLDSGARLETPVLSRVAAPDTLQPPVVASAGAKQGAGASSGDETVSAAIQAEGISGQSVSETATEMASESRPQPESFSIRLRGERWPQLFLVLWMFGASLMMVRLVRSYLSLRRLKRASRPLADTYQRRMGHWAKVCGIKRTVFLRGSKQITVPLMLGLTKTTILFPESLIASLGEDEFDQVLLHELAHVRRRDDWGNFAQKSVEAIFFFHPVVLWVGRQLCAERECACDQWVVSVTGARRSYAACLTRLFELTKRPDRALLASGVMPVKSHLSRRVETILKSKERLPASLSALGFFLPLCLLLAMMIQLGRLSPLVAVSGGGNPAAESAGHNAPERAALREQSGLENGVINRLPGHSPRGIDAAGVTPLLNDSEAMNPSSRESSTASETPGSSTSDGEMPRPRSWLEMVKAGASISPDGAGPAAFTLATGDRQADVSGHLTRSSVNGSPVIQEPAAAPSTLSSDEGRLPSDFFQVVAALGNSASQREILSALLKRRGLTKENLVQSLIAAKSIASDGEKAEFLVGAALFCTGETEVLSAFFNTVSTIGSAGERRRVLSALLTLKGRDKAVLFRTLKAAAAISSDGEKAELLVKAASLYAIDNTSLTAFLDAVSAISSSAEQRRALTALLRQGNPSSEAIIQTVRFARRISSDGEKAEFLERVAAVCPINDAVLSAYLATASSIHSSAEQARALSAISKRKEISRTTTTQTMSLARNNGDRD
jgi:beta-lactamase regulating signal transducer with metallopeptidase domain